VTRARARSRRSVSPRRSSSWVSRSWLRRPLLRRGAVGIVKKNAVPRPNVLSTQILPPCASKRPLTMASPSPAPPRLPRLPEAVEEVRDVLGGDAGARVRDPDAESPTDVTSKILNCPDFAQTYMILDYSRTRALDQRRTATIAPSQTLRKRTPVRGSPSHAACHGRARGAEAPCRAW
jgi:hypothetical protein